MIENVKLKFNIALILLSLLAMSVVLCSCGTDADSSDMIDIYMVNEDITDLVVSQSDLKKDTDDPVGMAVDLIDMYWLNVSSDASVSEAYKAYAQIEVENISLNDGRLIIDFNSAYNKLDKTSEMLYRSSVVETLVQISGIDYCMFEVEGEPLTDEEGNELGYMSESSFVLNPSSFFNSYQEVTLTLYFASEDGQSLVREDRDVYYLNSVSLQKLVVDQLIAGPMSDGLKASVPSTTNVISVTLLKGTCYVNLDEGFLTQDASVSEQVVIYSIVNSLFALGDIDSVRISVDGESEIVYRDSISLEEDFYEDLSMVDDSATVSGDFVNVENDIVEE